MKAITMYSLLERDFINKNLKDDWQEDIEPQDNLITENFKQRYMGLMYDFAQEINFVYTAVFPSDMVLKRIIDSGKSNGMLFLHHPFIWDINKKPIFTAMNKNYLKRLKERNISVYVLHVPLDNFSQYSTSKTLANSLNLKIIKPFAPYFGGLCGVICKTKLKTVTEMVELTKKTLGHDVSLYCYGNSNIKNNLVGVVAGGGNDMDTLHELKNEDINLLITGITRKNNHSKKVHDYEEKNNINLIGGTHYSTEKFACMKICDYFREKGLNAHFIEEKPDLDDL